MRNPVFRFRGLWAKQYGGAASAATLLYLGQQDFTTPGAATFTAPFNMVAEVFCWGGGAAGANGGPGNPGSGAGACMKRVSLATGQQLALNIGAGGTPLGAGAGVNPGTASTVTFPDGSTMTATGGQVAAGGTATGGEYNRSGGALHAAGVNGGPAGANGSSANGGGGAGGFSDLFTSPPALLGGGGGIGGSGSGGGGNAGLSPGGGGGGALNGGGGPGGGAKVSVVILQLV